MRRTRLLLGATAAALTALVALLGGVLRETGPAAGSAAGPAPAVPTTAPSPASRSATRRGRSRGSRRLCARAPRTARSLALLGLAYQQRARETADSSYLGRSEGVLRRALRLDRNDPLALSGLASLAASRHDFRTSLRLSRRVVALAPDTARGYGLLGDSLLELGRYDEAFRTFDRMVELKPNLGGYARIAYARELLGRPRQALEAMELALDASGNVPEPTAWTLVEIGKLHLSLGELDAGRSRVPRCARAPSPVTSTRSTASRRSRPRAVTRRGRSSSLSRPRMPCRCRNSSARWQTCTRRRGEKARAQEQIALIGAIERLLAANGINSDLELALFRLDHGIRLHETLALARAARADRPSIYGDDVLAWALARNGRCGEALHYSQRSLRLGTKDASLYFHRGMIERCLGHDRLAKRWFARAVETNPHFSLIWAATARRLAS